MANSQSGYLDVFDPEKQCWHSAYATLACHLLTWRALEESPFFRQAVSRPPLTVADRVRTVHLNLPQLDADSTPLGLHVSGGLDNNLPLFICKLSKDSVAERTGRLYAGDAILEVNGIDLKHATHYEAVEALRQAVATKYVELRVQYRHDTLQHSLVSSADDSSITDVNSQQSLADFKQAVPLEGCSVWHSSVPPHTPHRERCFQLHGPDGRLEWRFRARSVALCQTWVDALRWDITSRLSESVREANLLLAGNPDVGQVKALGWLNTKQQGSGDSSAKMWRLAFVAVCETQLLVYSTAPGGALLGPNFWTNPLGRHELLSSRLLWKALPDESDLCYDHMEFSLRTGTDDGVVARTFRAETAADFSHWTSTIQRAWHVTPSVIPTKAFDVTWRRQACRLVLDCATGMTVYSATTNQKLLSLPYDNIRKTADDGERCFSVWIAVPGNIDSVRQDLITTASSKPLLFTLYSYMAARSLRLGRFIS